MAASSDTFRVIMVITQPSEARPEAPRGRGQPRELEAAEEGVMGGQGKGNGLSLRHAVKHRHCIRGRGVDVGVPSDLSAAAVELLMLNGDKFKQLGYLCHHTSSCGPQKSAYCCCTSYLRSHFLEINWTEPLSMKVLSLIPALGFMWSLHVLEIFAGWTMNPTFLHSVLKLVGKKHIKRYHSVTILSSSAILYVKWSLKSAQVDRRRSVFLYSWTIASFNVNIWGWNLHIYQNPQHTLSLKSFITLFLTLHTSLAVLPSPWSTPLLMEISDLQTTINIYLRRLV